MRLKYTFVVREIDDTPIAVAVGSDNENFNGVVKLNSSGRIIFEMLNTKDVKFDDIVHGLIEKYDVDDETARNTVSMFLDYLRENGLIDE